jgi:tetratricopeptide (TPR) repeat protein/cell division protein FtsB
MKKLLLFHFVLLYCSSLFSQYTVRFIVQQPEPFEDKIYIAGSFNDWIPNDANYQLHPLDAKHFYVDVEVPPGRYEYKFTRGVWSTVEGAATGLDISNRAIELHRDTTVKIVIEGWMDKFKDISGLPDSTQWYVAYSRSFFYLDTNLDSSYKYAQQANAMLTKVDNKKYEADMARILGRIMQRQGNHQRALEYYLEQLSIVQQLKDTLSMAFCLLDIGHLFLGIKDYPNAKKYYLQVRVFNPYKTESFGRSAPNLALVGIGRVYYHTHQLDSARYYALQAYEVSLKLIDRPTQSEALTLLGNILEDEERIGEAIKYYLLAIGQARIFSNSNIIAENYQHIARAFYTNNDIDSSLYYAREAFGLASELKNPYTIMGASNMLVMLFKNRKQTDSAFTYLEKVVAAKDSLFNQNKNQQLQTILFNEELQKQENKAKEEQFKSQIKIYIMTGGIILLLFICLLLWWNIRRKHNVNKLLNEQGEKLQKTVAELKAARSQLTQKEKMASLGEFAAGIAYEIQEPLNSITNSSEAGMDIAKSLKWEVSGLNINSEQQLKLNSIVDDMVQNQQKIIDQGYQADEIVKSMLQHSRDKAGEDNLLL